MEEFSKRAEIEVLSQYFPPQNEGNHKNSCHDDSYLERLEPSTTRIYVS
jgi:hypothetical protein